MNTIDVTFVCWPNHPARVEYAKRCFDTVFERLTASRHKIVFRCSSESERDQDSSWCGDKLQRICDSQKMALVWRQGKADLGAAMNSAWDLCTAPVGMVIQDDFELLYPCDLSDGADLLDSFPQVDLIRYGWPPMTEWTESIHRFPRVKTDGMWPYGDEPQLRRRSFSEKWGRFTEYCERHGQSETDMLFKLVGGRAVILGSDKMYFGNCGAVSAVPKIREYRERAVSR